MLSCKRLALVSLTRPFSGSKMRILGTKRNRQGCTRTPRFLISNSHILWLIRPSG